ncbi:MAG: hypothetical protein IPI01_00530 [Ignavibacteriae bacterium]|nr:hypothetical protein [Ignavibacteriota bacterium]
MSTPFSGAAAGAAAAAKRRREQQEEEDMTGYTTDDVHGWEFKIVRSMFGSFRDPEKVRRLLEEEARAGWELIEKFDDSRIRLKRRTERRSNDAMLGYDAYRTTYGIPEYVIPIAILGAIGLGILIALLFANR